MDNYEENVSKINEIIRKSSGVMRKVIVFVNEVIGQVKNSRLSKKSKDEIIQNIIYFIEDFSKLKIENASVIDVLLRRIEKLHDNKLHINNRYYFRWAFIPRLYSLLYAAKENLRFREAFSLYNGDGLIQAICDGVKVIQESKYDMFETFEKFLYDSKIIIEDDSNYWYQSEDAEKEIPLNQTEVEAIINIQKFFYELSREDILEELWSEVRKQHNISFENISDYMSQADLYSFWSCLNDVISWFEKIELDDPEKTKRKDSIFNKFSKDMPAIIKKIKKHGKADRQNIIERTAMRWTNWQISKNVIKRKTGVRSANEKFRKAMRCVKPTIRKFNYGDVTEISGKDLSTAAQVLDVSVSDHKKLIESVNSSTMQVTSTEKIDYKTKMRDKMNCLYNEYSEKHKFIGSLQVLQRRYARIQCNKRWKEVKKIIYRNMAENSGVANVAKFTGRSK